MTHLLWFLKKTPRLILISVLVVLVLSSCSTPSLLTTNKYPSIDQRIQKIEEKIQELESQEPNHDESASEESSGRKD